MKRRTGVFVLAVLWMAAALGGAAQEERGPDVLGFGFGGGGAAAFFPGLDSVNAFLSENGLDPLCAFLSGGGGGGRGGVIGGLSIGGMGFGVAASSAAPARSAGLALGAGGFDLGFALGGDKGSVLTMGAVLGGGAAVLELSFFEVEPMGANVAGIVPAPVERVIGRAFAFVMPYVSMEAQLLPFMGIEVRIGYLLPVAGFDFGELVGIPAPALDLSGPFVGFSLVFGGIGGGDGESEFVATIEGTVDLGGRTRFAIEGGVGDVVISSYAVDAAQTTSSRIVEWAAVERGDSAQSLETLSVEVVDDPRGVELRSVGEGRVDYVVRVPAGTDVDVDLGAGSVRIVGHRAQSVDVSVGAGEVGLVDVWAARLHIELGAGELRLRGTQAPVLSASVGAGTIALELPLDASATISASTGIGDVRVTGFPEMTARVRRFLLAASADAVLGAGAADVRLSAGIGEIVVLPRVP